MDYDNYFMNAFDRNESTTENGASGYSTTKNPIMDLNALGANRDDSKLPNLKKLIYEAFYSEDYRYYILPWLFYLRDAREGLGERKRSIDLLSYFFSSVLHKYKEDTAFINSTKLALERFCYLGRWDDIIYIANGAYSTYSKESSAKVVLDVVFDIMEKQLLLDTKEENEPSLLAKWIKTPRCRNKHYGEISKMMKEFYNVRMGWSDIEASKNISSIRKRLNLVETHLSEKNYSNIDYTKTPSVANLRYAKAFRKHDEERYSQYLEDVANGVVKINANISSPVEIWKLLGDDDNLNITLQTMWDNMPDKFPITKRILVAVDDSGSMDVVCPGTSFTAESVARSLGVYLGQRLTGPLKNKYIAFSDTTRIVDFNHVSNDLNQIKEYCESTEEHTNTNVESVFMDLLNFAVKNKLDKKELPEIILSITDMEFDETSTPQDGNLFESIEKRFMEAGYEMPKSVFWNVNSRTDTLPVIGDKHMTVSGFSVNILKQILSDNVNPWESLREILDSDRYNYKKEI